ncbi:hypothetical protein U1Q18_011744 [Sarracenia purpurea var. burkii]
MAFQRTLAQRKFYTSKTWNPILRFCRVSSSPSAVQPIVPPNPAKVDPDPGDDLICRRFFPWIPIYQSAATAAGSRPLPIGGNLLDTLRNMDVGRDRIRLDGLSPPPVTTSESTTVGKLTVEEARKLLRVSQLEMVKSELRQIRKDRISFEEFVQICSESCGNKDRGLDFVKMLDESGTVIVLGNVVFLRPDQVVKIIQDLIPVPAVHPNNNPMWKELEEMEKQKAAIDKRADSLVRRELWCGLGYLVIQTAAFMRLTFWELSWDVMEPICFYVTSVYFMAGYAFFLRTSKEPSFEGFFRSRFSAKQKRLMEIHNFDIGRYKELRGAWFALSSSPGNASSFTPSFDNSERTHTGALH